MQRSFKRQLRIPGYPCHLVHFIIILNQKTIASNLPTKDGAQQSGWTACGGTQCSILMQEFLDIHTIGYALLISQSHKTIGSNLPTKYGAQQTLFILKEGPQTPWDWNGMLV